MDQAGVPVRLIHSLTFKLATIQPASFADLASLLSSILACVDLVIRIAPVIGLVFRVVEVAKPHPVRLTKNILVAYSTENIDGFIALVESIRISLNDRHISRRVGFIATHAHMLRVHLIREQRGDSFNRENRISLSTVIRGELGPSRDDNTSGLYDDMHRRGSTRVEVVSVDYERMPNL
jgi:hypothetical protein